MKLREIYNTDKTVISFEVFPPKTNEKNLLEEISILKKYSPAFISLTYGAGGSENKSINLLKEIQKHKINIMPHFTCITSTKENVEKNINTFIKIGAESILALRGDIPADKDLIKKEFSYASELVKFIKERTDLSIGVAGYPEGHIESPDFKTDIENLKRKIDAGADAIFTQLFFINDKFYDFVSKIRFAGINVPIIAGIMPIISATQIKKMTSMANITIPKIIIEYIQKYSGQDLINYGIEYATNQCTDLIKNGENKLHFFTLNKAYSTSKILDNLRGKI